MRTRARLIDVLRTVNPALYPLAADIFGQTALYLESGGNARQLALLIDGLEIIRRYPSSHLWDLATEALLYMEILALRDAEYFHLERLTLDDKGKLDEIVTHGRGAHLERMDKRKWFLSMTRADGSSVAIWIDGDVKHWEQRV